MSSPSTYMSSCHEGKVCHLHQRIMSSSTWPKLIKQPSHQCMSSPSSDQGKVISKRIIIKQGIIKASPSCIIINQRHHQVISNKALPSPSSKDQAIIKYIDWTMGSTIKCNGSKPSCKSYTINNHHQQSSKAWDHHQLSKAP